MCGRYTITSPPSALERLFGRLGQLPNFPARFNAAPSQALPIIRHKRNGGRELALAHWGLVPSWSKGPDSRFSMINARAETVATKPAYRGAYRHRRCLVPATGFFEWQAGPRGKQPWYFTVSSHDCFAFAGLWEHWTGAGGDELESFAIVVTDANELVAPVHGRMPVILAPEDHARWLGEAEAATRDLGRLLKPYPAHEMKAWRVSTRVNGPHCDEPSLIEPWLEEEQKSLLI